MQFQGVREQCLWSDAPFYRHLKEYANILVISLIAINSSVW